MKSFTVSQLMGIIIRMNIYIYFKIPKAKHLSEITLEVKKLLRGVLVSTQS